MAAMGDGAKISDGLRQAGLLANALRPVMLVHSEALKAQGQSFSQVQTVLITALMHELALAIASGPARLHRGQMKIVAQDMPRLVMEAAIAQRRAVPEPGQ
jgi:hypothetical protein